MSKQAKTFGTCDLKPKMTGLAGAGFWPNKQKLLVDKQKLTGHSLWGKDLPSVRKSDYFPYVLTLQQWGI